MNRAVFIAGTDTGIGKTHVACALLHALRAAGDRACGMKPVASGCMETPAGLRNEDALALQAASSDAPAYALINPVALRDPLSPHLAAAHDGVTIALPPLRAAFEALSASHRRVVVEGVGGWLVPLAPGLFASDIAVQWKLPVLLVVGLRLGCLNHALLSARAIAADGCQLLGWIGNRSTRTCSRRRKTWPACARCCRRRVWVCCRMAWRLNRPLRCCTPRWPRWAEAPERADHQGGFTATVRR